VTLATPASKITADRFLGSYLRRAAISPEIRSTHPSPRGETPLLREDMLASLHRGEVCPASEIFARVRAQWGSVKESRLHGILRWLRTHDLVEYAEGGYRLTEPGRALRASLWSETDDAGESSEALDLPRRQRRPRRRRCRDPRRESPRVAESGPDPGPTLEGALLREVAVSLLEDLGVNDEDPRGRVDCRVLIELCERGRTDHQEPYVHQVWSLVLGAAIRRASSGRASRSVVESLSRIPVEDA
jgi:hypothetical protein